MSECDCFVLVFKGMRKFFDNVRYTGMFAAEKLFLSGEIFVLTDFVCPTCRLQACHIIPRRVVCSLPLSMVPFACGKLDIALPSI